MQPSNDASSSSSSSTSSSPSSSSHHPQEDEVRIRADAQSRKGSTHGGSEEDDPYVLWGPPSTLSFGSYSSSSSSSSSSTLTNSFDELVMLNLDKEEAEVLGVRVPVAKYDGRKWFLGALMCSLIGKETSNIYASIRAVSLRVYSSIPSFLQ